MMCWGHHLDVFNLHDGLDGRNIFWQSIKPVLEDKIGKYFPFINTFS